MHDSPDDTGDTGRLQQGMLEALGDASPDGILALSREGRLLYFNRRFVDMWRIPESVMAAGWNAQALGAVEQRLVEPRAFHARIAYLNDHPEVVASDAIRLKDGRTFERYSVAMRGADGTVDGRVAFFRDVSDRLTAEEAWARLIREGAARENALRHTVRLRALHEAALTIAASVSAEPEAVTKLLARVIRHAVEALEGQDGRLVLAENDVWQELVPESSPSEGLVLLVHGERLRRSPQRPHGLTAHVLASGELVHVEDTLAGTGHGPFPSLAEMGIASFVVAPLIAGQRVLGALSVMFGEHRELADEDRDALRLFAAHAAAALERVRLAAERQAALQDLAKRDAEAVALRELDRLRGNLLLMISHELRTPLTLIHGYAELLQARIGSLSPAGAQTMANRIHSASTQLARLMDDLFDFTRLQHGDVLGRPVVLDLVPVLREVVDRLRDRPGGGGLVFQGRGPLFVRGSQERITQALSNLLENALTYAPDGPIVVRVLAGEAVGEPVSDSAAVSEPHEGSPAGEAGGDMARAAGAAGDSHPVAWVRVEVQDQGPGLPLDEQPRVWESFFRGSRVAGLNVAPGSGIGLAAVKAIVGAHGGAVGLRSDPGHGACFWFSLPLVVETPPPAQTPPPRT